MKTFLCNVTGREWEQPIQASTPGQAKSIYQLGLKDSWPDIQFTAITCRRLLGPPQNTAEDLQRQCDAWNREHPIGTAVHYHPVIGEEAYRATRTKTAAYVLSGHTAVLHVESESGCVALDAISIGSRWERVR